MNLPAGAYSYVANVEGTPLTDKGRFVINDANLEQLNLTANWDLLRKIATNSGGRLVLRENLAKLPDQLAELPGQKSISRQSVRYRDLIDEKWLFFVLIGFLFVEWFARRWSGSYWCNFVVVIVGFNSDNIYFCGLIRNREKKRIIKLTWD